MSSTFEMVPRYRFSPRRSMVGNNRLNWFLKSNGYSTNYVLVPYYALGQEKFFQGNIFYSSSNIKAKYVTSIKRESTGFTGYQQNFILDGILEGEFKFDIDIDTDVSSGEEKKITFSDVKRSLLKNTSEDPFFLYAHSRFPGHSQNSGICLEDERERFYQKLQIANDEMVSDIDIILAKNKDAIIIVAGDHGAYLTGNCRGDADPADRSKNNITNFADTYGIFVAVRWPDESYHEFDSFQTLQDLFLSVIAYMTQDKTPLSLMSQDKICHRHNCASPDGRSLDVEHLGKNIFDKLGDYQMKIYRP